MDKRSLLAVVLSLLILIGYQQLISYLYPPPEDTTPPQPVPEAESPPPPSVPQPLVRGEAQEHGQAPRPTPLEVHALEQKEITVENAVYTAVLTSLGGRLKSFRLKHYPGDEGKGSPPLEMVQAGTVSAFPLAVHLEGDGWKIEDDTVPYTVRGHDIQLQASEEASLEFTGTTPDGMHLTKVFSFSGDSYGLHLEVHVSGVPPSASSLSLVWTEGLDQEKLASYYSVYGPVALVGRKFLYESASQVEQEDYLESGQIRWAGLADSYFLAAMIPPQGSSNRLLSRVANGTIETALTIPWNGESVSYTLYVGPKEINALNAVDPALDRAIDFGWFHFVARPLVSLLRLFYTVTGNYGVAIILLTVLVKLAFFPLSNKSFKSMSEMRKLQPQLERLREQYKDDRQQLNKEMMELYRRYNVNPLGGCLPMLVQLPVFIGLYQGLLYAIELRQAPFLGWIQDLSQPDRLGTLALPFIDPPGIPVLTVIMGGSMLLQQMMTPMSGDPTQQKMMMIMPVVFTVMFVNFPSGLVLYWLVNNILSVAQQYWHTKKFG